MLTLYLTRHGETQENVAQILQGHLPGNLTEEGKKQALDLSGKLSDIKFDAVISSDLRRALDTAAILAKPHALPVVPCPMLRERDWGEFTGKSLLGLRTTIFPESVETVEEMFRRAEKLIRYLQKAFNGKTVLAIGHGLFNRCLIATLEGKQIRDVPRIQNTEVRIVEISQFTGYKDASRADAEASAN